MRSLKHFLIIIALSFILTSCGSSGGGDDTAPESNPTGSNQPAATASYVTGTAATGAAIEGRVTVTGVNGKTFTVSIKSTGFFKVNVSSLSPPFLLKAKGKSNGKDVTLYSTAIESGTTNITPVTNMIMAIALGENPVRYYASDSTGKDVPSNDDIASAKERLEKVFTPLGLELGLDIDEDFDLIQSEFVADQTNFDSMLDAIEISYIDKFAIIKDRSSHEILYKIDLETEVEVTESAIEIENIFIQIKALIDAGASNEELNNLTLSLIDDDFLDNGYGSDNTIVNWNENSNYPVKDVTYTGFSIYRNMEIQQIGNTDISEYGDNFEGFWCKITYTTGSTSNSFLTSFVRESEDAPLKWYGNRCPLSNGGKAEVKAFNIVDTNSSYICSGLAFWASDSDDFARSLNINKILILNSAMPNITINQISSESLNALLMTKENSNKPLRYGISNIANQVLFTEFGWKHQYMQEDGLDLSKFDSREFVFAGLDDNDNIQHIWIDLIPAIPVSSIDLTDENFADIISPETHNLAELTIPGDIDVSWDNPEGSYTAEIQTDFKTTENPGLNDENIPVGNWETNTLNIINNTLKFNLFLINKDQSNRYYYTIWKMDTIWG